MVSDELNQVVDELTALFPQRRPLEKKLEKGSEKILNFIKKNCDETHEIMKTLGPLRKKEKALWVRFRELYDKEKREGD